LIYEHPLFPKFDDDYDFNMHRFITSVEFGQIVCTIVPQKLRSCFNQNPDFRLTIDEVIESLTPLCDPNYQYDHTIKPKNNPIDCFHNSHINYFEKMLSKIQHFYPEQFNSTPKNLFFMMYDLINRSTQTIKNMTDQHVNEIIRICYGILDTQDRIPIESIINERDILISNEIIMNNGFLFRNDTIKMQSMYNEYS
jgi:hypothetical protein